MSMMIFSPVYFFCGHTLDKNENNAAVKRDKVFTLLTMRTIRNYIQLWCFWKNSIGSKCFSVPNEKKT